MNWTLEQVLATYQQPFMDLVFQAAQVHRTHHDPNRVQISTLISIKTGGCPEDCAYCPQAARYHTAIEKNDLMPLDQVVELAQRARSAGSSRVCMGAAWRNVRDGEDFERVLEMVRTLNGMQMEVCCTLGMLTQRQAERLAEAGLYAYNHNIDTSEQHYKEIVRTRAFADRLQTLENVRKTNVTLCSGGIIGMGEALEDRAQMLLTLLPLQPESIPINALVPVAGTPLADQPLVDPFEMVRMVATARIVFPQAQVRLSAGRHTMNEQTQALCFLAGANSIFSGEKLLTTPNPDHNQDQQLFEQLGLQPMQPFEHYPRRESVPVEEMSAPLGERPTWTRP